MRPASVPGPKILLLAPNSPDGIHAQRLLQEKGLDFLVVRPDNVQTEEDDEEIEPVLVAGTARYTGFAAIRQFVDRFARDIDAERIRRTLHVLQELDIKPDMTPFSTRLRVQKIIYLLQELGLQTKWNFGWYIRGPYSPDLAHELFKDQGKGRKEPVVSADAAKALQLFRDKFGNSPLNAQQLEAAAAVVFVAKSTRLRSKALATKVCEQKPYLPKELIEEYVKKLYP